MVWIFYLLNKVVPRGRSVDFLPVYGLILSPAALLPTSSSAQGATFLLKVASKSCISYIILQTRAYSVLVFVTEGKTHNKAKHLAVF